MPVKPISSYPFLKIAKESGLRYEIVLAVADVYIHGRLMPGLQTTQEENDLVDEHQASIANAAANFKRIVNEGWDQSNG